MALKEKLKFQVFLLLPNPSEGLFLEPFIFIEKDKRKKGNKYPQKYKLASSIKC